MTETTKTTEISRDMALAAVTRYLQMIATAPTPEDISSLYSADATLEDPVGSEPSRGRSAIADFFGPLTRTRRETELLNFRHSGNSAAFHFRVRTHTPDGIVEIDPFDVMTFSADGLITSAKAYWSPDDVRMS